MSKFVDCERDQAYLLSPDLRNWISEDDLVHFVIEAVERVEMSAFKVNHRGTGAAQYHPPMMLSLLICGRGAETRADMDRPSQVRAISWLAHSGQISHPQARQTATVCGR